MRVEVPSIQDLNLRDLVVKKSIHKPSGPLHNPSAVGMKYSISMKCFPKQFLNETFSVKGNSYITYKRHYPAVSGEQVEIKPQIIFADTHESAIQVIVDTTRSNISRIHDKCLPWELLRAITGFIPQIYIYHSYSYMCTKTTPYFLFCGGARRTSRSPNKIRHEAY